MATTPALVPSPVVPAPGDLESAVGLLLARVAPLRPDLWAMLRAHLLGVDGGPPVPAGVAAEAAGFTRSWLRDLLGQVRALALATGPPACVAADVEALQGGPVRALEQARAALVEAGVSSAGVHPGALLRVAEVVGVACRAQLVQTGGVVVLAPTGRAALERDARAAAAAAVCGVDVVSVAAVAEAAGMPSRVVAGVLDRDARWVVLQGGDGSWWCWRRGARPGQRGLVAATVVRLLAVRAYAPSELRAAVVEVLSRVPPSARAGVDVERVAPGWVWVAWLVSGGLLATGEDQDAADVGGSGGALRCPPEAGVRSDLVMADAVRAAGRPVSTAELAAALAEAGYAPSSSTQLARTSPVLRRVGWDAYMLR
ncbi:hypothetical protein [Pseudokineococcus marinus]|uniref:Uncharacterized protein n=1 Tax=Pseudokineococcus marinus TaxID=351215 RepID=A0A849BF73_9ACTN|nr:hypothetical protein [Pseudokineococcus marinus]NNH21709.1 hypothetical protein [Pseudokineococcus marinus]